MVILVLFAFLDDREFGHLGRRLVVSLTTTTQAVIHRATKAIRTRLLLGFGLRVTLRVNAWPVRATCVRA